jgi:hypothetical protein
MSVLHGPDPTKVMPLDEFPPDMRALIDWQVAQPEPPEKWLDLGLAQIQSRGWWEWHWQRGSHPERKRPRLPKFLRAKVIERDGLVCGICDGEVELADVHIDHIHPVSRGGTDDLDNLQVTHSACNIAKAARV